MWSRKKKTCDSFHDLTKGGPSARQRPPLSHVIPGAVEGLEALRHRPRAVLRLPLHRHEVEACTEAPAGRDRRNGEKRLGEDRDGMEGAEQQGVRVFRYGRLLMALPRAQIQRMRCDHLSPTTPRPPNPILRSPPPAKPLASTWALSCRLRRRPFLAACVRARWMGSTCEMGLGRWERSAAACSLDRIEGEILQLSLEIQFSFWKLSWFSVKFLCSKQILKKQISHALYPYKHLRSTELDQLSLEKYEHPY